MTGLKHMKHGNLSGLEDRASDVSRTTVAVVALTVDEDRVAQNG